MTGAGTGKEPWDDDRLAAAFREAFDVTAPRGLEDRVAAAMASAARPRSSRLGWLRWSGASAIAAVAAVVITAGVLISNGLPSASPRGSGVIGSPSTSTPIGTPTAGFPTTIFGIDVLSVPGAIEIRDRGEATELAVAGWYQQAGPVLCPVEPTEPSGPFEGGCTLATQWLMADPETLVPLPDTMLGGPSPAGPAIRPVFDGVEAGWGYPVSIEDIVPRPVVFLGHFNDARADDCRAEASKECRALFVVDQVPWLDGAAYDAVFPADIDGIPVRSVEETIARRDAGELSGIEVAIGGWYAESPPIPGPSCRTPPDPRGPLERYCEYVRRFLTDTPQVIEITTTPIGSAVEPYLPPIWNSGFVPEPWKSPPVVLVGHVEDPLSIDCPHLGVETCRGFFVVDRIAWIDGQSLGPRVPSDTFFDPVPRTRTAAEVAQLVRKQLPGDGTVQSMTVLEAREIGSLDPIAGGAVEDRGVVWYVRAVERGTNRVGSFIVDDATGELLWSEFPMGSTIVIAVP